MLAQRALSVAVMTSLLLIAGVLNGSSAYAGSWHIGFGKVDITPIEPVRLSGYATRSQPHEGIADPLHARAMVISESLEPGSKTVVLVSVDSIAIVADMTKRIHEQLQNQYQLARADVVICSTHSHAAPHAASGLTNLYRTPLSDEQRAALDRNTARVEQGIVQAIAKAMEARQLAQLQISQATADFAVNRRVLKDGIWSGFGVQLGGPVDRRVRVLKAQSAQGNLLGAAYMYACHCTTLGPSFNQVSGDWAGLSASALEQQHAGSVFLPVIGCGADANPEPRTSYEDAQRHAVAMTASVTSALAQAGQGVTEFPTAHFGYAGLAPEMPTRAELEAGLTDKDVVRRSWSESMLATWKKMGRLPETYPAPIHTWQFGENLLWIFLGGEVVVDYQLRFEKTFAPKAAQVWVAAYTDDVFAYVASERMRAEGGYEVDFSMLYYNQPGRWQSGTEDLLERRVSEVLKESMPEDKPRDAQAALKSIRVPDGFTVDLMAAEPQVDDPVNIAFGHDGSVWVVEMSDYPLGTPGGGRVRRLRDADHDGKFEQSHVFLSGLDYPSSVIPWRDGVIVIAAPTIFFAADRDGDGTAEIREDLLKGIGPANPQHRASGFEIGLDGWLHFTSGDDTRELLSTRTGKTHQVAGRDICWHPDSGRLFTTTGHTQFVRARDEFGNWFGNVNNQPMYHYAIEDQYRSRGGLSGPAIEHLLDPPIAPPVYPFSRTQDRFNDLFTFNRFTSACSSIICRVPGLGESMRGAALVCEPVHNLVARFHVQPEGSSFSGFRFQVDAQYDWFASSDPFSRPVRAVNAPDGTIWVVDMVRQVIEHPQWIPTSWQQRLNVRAGSGLGRIYRVRRQDYQPSQLPEINQASESQLLQWLGTDNGALRDLAAQQLLWRSSSPKPGDTQQAPTEAINPASKVASELLELVKQSPLPAVRVQALGSLVGLGPAAQGELSAAWSHALHDKDSRVRRAAVMLADQPLHDLPLDKQPLLLLAEREQDSGVLLQLSLTLGGVGDAAAAPAIEAIARHAAQDTWLAKSLALVGTAQVQPAVSGMIHAMQRSSAITSGTREALESSISSLWSRCEESARQTLLARVFQETSPTQVGLADVQILLMTAVAESGWDSLTKDPQIQRNLSAAVASAVEQLRRPDVETSQRVRLVPILALQPGDAATRLNSLVELLNPTQPPDVQLAALNVLRKLKSNETPNLLLSRWNQYLPDIRTSITAMLLERRPWGEQLIAALESQQIRVSDLDAATLERLRSYGDRNLMARSERILGKPPTSDRNRLVNEALARWPQTGNSAQGERLFAEHCAVCHRAKPNQAMVGPPLDNLGNWTNQQWLIAILDPNRAIEPKYHQYSVLTTDGQTLAGLIEDRSSAGLTLATADGRRHEIKLAEIDQLKDLGVSLMPEGLESKLSHAALADLVAYLQTAKSSR